MKIHLKLFLIVAHGIELQLGPVPRSMFTVIFAMCVPP